MTARSGIVGRDPVLATCTSALEAARSGSGGLVLLTGEAGIGKTTVMQAVTSRARSDGFQVAWAACVEDDAVPAFWPVVTLLAGIGHAETSAAAEELRGGEQGPAGEHRFVLFDQVASALRIAATTRPLVLMIDDLHWADPSSVRLLAFVVKQIRTAPVLVVGSYRDTDVGIDHPLWHLLAEPGSSGETLTLSGLGTDEVAALLGVARGAGSPDDAGGRHAEAGAASIRDHTGGNPFFVLNVVRLLEAEGHDLASGRPLPLPAGVRAVLDRRLARLSQPCHELLGTAAVIGHRFDVTLLSQVSGIRADVVAGLLEESARSRLTQPVGGAEHEFAHALVRATLTAQLATRQREAVHARVADALSGRHGEEDVRWAAIAHHDLSAGADRAATRGVVAAERAARHAMAARAFEAAAELLERAVAAGAAPEQEAHLLLALGDAHLHGGDWHAAGDAFSRAADLARELGRADLVARAALGVGSDPGGFEVRLGDHRQLGLLEEALVLLDADHPELRSRLLARRSVAATNLASPTDRQRWSDEAVRLAREAGDGPTVAHALSAWCDVQSGPAHTEARLGATTKMLAVAESTGDRQVALTARRFRVVALLELGSPEVHQEIERFAAIAEQLGSPLYRWYVPLFHGMQALLRGDLPEAGRLSAQAAALGAEAGSDNAEMLSGTLAAAIMMERGEVTELLARFEVLLAEHAWMRELPIALAMGPLIELVAGRPDQAHAKLRLLAAGRFDVVPVDSEWLSTLAGISWSVLLAEEVVSAAVMYELLLPHAGRMVVDGIAASCLDPVDYLLGRLALLLGRRHEAVQHLEAAVAQTSALAAPLLEAHARHALGAALADVDPERAGALRSNAEEVLRAAGAAPWLLLGTTLPGAPGAPGAPGGPGAETRGGAAARRRGVFRRDGALWELAFEGDTVRLADAKGLHDLRYLLSHPGSQVPAAALRHADDPQAGPASRGVDLLDDQARAAYRRRLEELDADLDDAVLTHDDGRAARAQEERAALVAELSAAAGLGGRARRMGDDVDRARKSVTMRIRNAIARIDRVHPALGRHLSLTVRTGAFCSYEPDQGVDWTV